VGVKLIRTTVFVGDVLNASQQIGTQNSKLSGVFDRKKSNLFIVSHMVSIVMW
jgi:hypothetical protein